MFIQDQQEDQL